MSTKKLPSRKMRGRIWIVASLWIGRPFLSIRIVTRAAFLSLGRRSTEVTLPTLTPAIRTNEFGLMLFAVRKTAWIS